MKNSTLKILGIFLILAGVLYAGAEIFDLQARSDGTDVYIEWKSSKETNLDFYEVERRSPQTAFTSITKIPAKGNNSFYSYKDESAYKNNNVLFIYRIKIVENADSPNYRGTSYSKEISVNHSISNVKRTWGSIKAMFR